MMELESLRQKREALRWATGHPEKIASLLTKVGKPALWRPYGEWEPRHWRWLMHIEKPRGKMWDKIRAKIKESSE